jgi:hypothetical protein
MRKWITALLLCVTALFGLSACSFGQKAKEYGVQPNRVQQVAYQATYSGFPIDKLLRDRGYVPARAVMHYDDNTRQTTEIGAVYLKCDGQKADDCAQHFLTRATNANPGVWVTTDGTVKYLQGSLESDVLGGASFMVDTPQGVTVYQNGKDVHIDYQHPDASQLDLLLAGVNAARAKYHSSSGQWLDDYQAVDGVGTVHMHMVNLYASTPHM